MSVSADLYTVTVALQRLPVECRYHGTDFGSSGYLGPHQGGVPRCESCRPAWSRMCALDAVARVKERLAQPSILFALSKITEPGE